MVTQGIQKWSILKKTHSRKIITAVEHFFSRHGYPQTIKTDNGSNFTSQEFEDFCTVNGIRHITSQPYWPRGNAAVERFNRTLLKAIRTMHSEGRNWKTELPKFLLDYRSTPHSTTEEAAAKLLFNRNIRTKLPSCDIHSTENKPHHDLVKRRDVKTNKEKMKTLYDRRMNVSETDIEVGDIVLMNIVLMKQKKENKLSTLYRDVEYKVIKAKGTGFVIRGTGGEELLRNVSQLKKLHKKERTENENVQEELIEEQTQKNQEEEGIEQMQQNKGRIVQRQGQSVVSPNQSSSQQQPDPRARAPWKSYQLRRR